MDTLDYMLDYTEILIQKIPDTNQYKQELLTKYLKYRTLFENNPKDTNLRYFVLKYVTDLEAYVKGYSSNPPSYDYEELPVLLEDKGEDFSNIVNLNEYVDILTNSIDNLDQIPDAKSLSTLTNHVQEEYSLIKVKNQKLDQKICRALFVLMLNYIKDNEIEAAKNVAKKFDLDMRIYLINYFKHKIEPLKEKKKYAEAEFIWKYIYGTKPIKESDIELWYFIANLEGVEPPVNSFNEEVAKQAPVKEKQSFMNKIKSLVFLVKSSVKKIVIRNNNGECNSRDLIKAIDTISSKMNRNRYELVYSEGIKNIHFYISVDAKNIKKSNFDNLVSIVIPNSAEKICNSAFRDCTGLRTVKMKNTNISIIEDYAFYNSSIETIDFSDSLTSIGDYAFSQCQNLEIVNLKNTCLKTIGYSAFSNSGIKQFEIPKSLVEVKAYCFAETLKLDKINFINSDLITIGEFAFAESGISAIFFNSELVSIGKNAFEGTKYLTSVSLFNTSVTELSDQLFKRSSISNLELPKSLKIIGDSVFLECKTLTRLNLNGTSVDTIKDYAFALSSITTIIMSPTLKELNPHVFDFAHKLRYVNLIPTAIEVIKGGTFRNTTISYVLFNSQIKKIEKYAFERCPYLSKIDVSRCTSEVFNSILEDIFYVAWINKKSVHIVGKKQANIIGENNYQISANNTIEVVRN